MFNLILNYVWSWYDYFFPTPPPNPPFYRGIRPLGKVALVSSPSSRKKKLRFNIQPRKRARLDLYEDYVGKL